MTIGTSRMIGQPLYSIPLCPQPFEGLHPTLTLSILIYYLSISFSVCLSFSLLVPRTVGSSLQVLLIFLFAHTISICVSHSGYKLFIRPNSMPDSVPHFFIRNMVPVGDAQKTLEASHFCILYFPF